MPDIPERLLRRGRDVDPVFEPDEVLYRACERREVIGAHLATDAIGFREWSVNRGKYSLPEDVLIGRDGDGVAAIRVGDVPTSLVSQGNVAFDFRPDHVPYDENYSHSWIIAGRDGTFQRDLDLPQLIKKLFRQIMSDKSAILMAPQS